MSQAQDEDIRIYQLPEAQELTTGMKVAVDNETDGTKSFDLSNLAGKVDEPETAPEAGQVLTFDGTENTWANPPEGVYMLKYSEVTDLDDVDLDKATTIPTFILIDSEQRLTIGNGSSGTTIAINAGTIMRLEEIRNPDDAGKPTLLTFVNGYGNSATGGTYMTDGNYFVRLVVSKSMYGGVSKRFGVSADIWGSNLFRSQQIPVVKKYDNARGPAASSGNLNGDANSLIVSFEDAGSNKRRQLLPPAELATHDFSSDATPEQIQFMGWGATSNRAGYKTISEVPASTAQDEGKVLTVDSNGAAAWENQSIMVVHYSIVPNDGAQLDKTFSEIKAACDAHIPVLLIGPNFGIYSGYIGGEIYTVNGYTATSIVFRSSILPHLQIPGGMMTDNSGVCQITLSDQNTLSYDTILIKAIGTIDKGIGGSVSTSSVEVPNNSYSSITTSQSSLTINIPNGEYGPTNIVVEITPTVNCTVTVTRTDSQSTETLKYSVSAGNTLEAGKYYQVTAVGNCWTLAEFENPS